MGCLALTHSLIIHNLYPYLGNFWQKYIDRRKTPDLIIIYSFVDQCIFKIYLYNNDNEY